MRSEEIEAIKNDINNIIKKDEKLFGTSINFILVNQNNSDIKCIVSDGMETIVGFDKDTNNYYDIPYYDYNFDKHLFGELDKNYHIGYMNDIDHYYIWRTIMELYPENLNYKDGVQKYLQYCVDNGITKEYIDDKTGFDTPDIMDFFVDLTFHGSMQYKGYYVEVGDVNYDNPNENIVTIYGSKEDSLNGDFLENISLNTLGLKQNIKEYIDKNYKDKSEAYKIYSGNLKVLKSGSRRGQLVTLMEKELNDNVEYIISYYSKNNSNDFFWVYGSYYGNDKSKAEQDFKKALSCVNLSKKFKDKEVR